MMNVLRRADAHEHPLIAFHLLDQRAIRSKGAQPGARSRPIRARADCQRAKRKIETQWHAIVEAAWATATDVLPLVDPKILGLAGDWSSDGNALSCKAGKFTRIAFPYAPPEEYDLRLDFTRTQGGSDVNLMFLDVSPEVLIQRLAARPDHFFPDKLLNSQLETLEKPSSVERPHVRVINADGDPNEVAAVIIAALWPYGEPGST